jgi:hypothetical protein
MKPRQFDDAMEDVGHAGDSRGGGSWGGEAEQDRGEVLNELKEHGDTLKEILAVLKGKEGGGPAAKNALGKLASGAGVGSEGAKEGGEEDSSGGGSKLMDSAKGLIGMFEAFL